ncbi:diguanylate cyclase [Halomicronema hongdechloris C2206]|uniref:Adenylate cyclase n=1 Tax=Halomicronema hongdechloris C2206 TaxID=1641165 RepID=A0A1Z3HFN3_9CYAN|nr:adenylate/guanylate cyclase domain-containing protein [Halomicronema hongdechloris]ASC69090.1 diguanylate cyclase [Halomicronema hongdechloris C2206]
MDTQQQPLTNAPVNGTIFLIDCDRNHRRHMAEVLSQHDYLVYELTTGHDIWQQIETHVPDVIFLDIELPDISGYRICQRLKENLDTRPIPVVFLSRLSDYRDKINAFEVGAADFITKPCHPEEVLARVQNQLYLYRQRQQLSQQNALLLDEVRERTQIEQALRQAEAKYRSIFENSTAGIFQTTEDGHYLSVNAAMAHIYGYGSPQEMIATITTIAEQVYVQPKRRQELIAYLKRFDKITDAESQVYRQDGTCFWISEDIWSVRDDQGRFLCYEGIVHDISERRQMEDELRQQRQQADRLLINILPYQIAQRLKLGSRVIAENFDEVSVLFADLVDFTAASSQMTPQELVKLLNDIFSAFDQLAAVHSLEKIKTIGDAYMVAAGLPAPRSDHAIAIARMALDMQAAIQRFPRPDGSPFQLRIGINTGPVVAGVIGKRKFAYDLWGDTVNLASRMETTGEPQQIQTTAVIYEHLKESFTFQQRGTIAIKGRGPMTTYWLIGVKK